jgi:hypothetical protein
MLGAVNSKVHTLTRLRAGRYGVRIPTATRDSCLVQKSDRVWISPALLFEEYRRVKRKKFEVGHSLQHRGFE